MYRAWLKLSVADRLRLETALLPVNDLSVSDARDRLGELAEQTWARSPLLAESRTWSSVGPRAEALRRGAGCVPATPPGVAGGLARRAPQGCARPLPGGPEAEREGQGRAPRRDARFYLRNTEFGPRCKVEDFANDEKFALLDSTRTS